MLCESGVDLLDASAVLGDFSFALSNSLQQRLLLARKLSLGSADAVDGRLKTEELLRLSLSRLQSGLDALLHLLGINGRLGRRRSRLSRGCL